MQHTVYVLTKVVHLNPYLPKIQQYRHDEVFPIPSQTLYGIWSSVWLKLDSKTFADDEAVT